MTLRAAVLGHPISHSLSPVLHRAAYAELGLAWTYEAIDVQEADLAAFVESLGPEWAGLSLTMPLKEAVLSLLDEVEPIAAAVRSVNTVVLRGGRRVGYNTDITGLRGIVAGLQLPRGATATVIGAGATARSVVAALADAGVAHLTVLARRADARDDLVALSAALGLQAKGGGWPPKPADLAHDVVVSTVPAAATTHWELPTEPGTLVDVLYHPWPTPLADRWAERGGRGVGGLELLVRQAVEQVELMTGRRPSLDTVRAAGEVALASREIAQAEQ
jgi:shikimate dehydrogenase